MTYGWGGRGGGVIRIEVTGELILDGTISANGANHEGGGGAGGGILLVSKTFGGSTSGILSANGAFGSTRWNGGGGGGRIAVWYGPAPIGAWVSGRIPRYFVITDAPPDFHGVVSVNCGIGWADTHPDQAEPEDYAAPGTSLFLTSHQGTVIETK